MTRRVHRPRVIELDGLRFELAPTGPHSAAVYVRTVRRRDAKENPVYGPLRKATRDEVVRLQAEIDRREQARARRDQMLDELAPWPGEESS